MTMKWKGFRPLCFWQLKLVHFGNLFWPTLSYWFPGQSFPEPVKERGFVVVRWECVNPAEVAGFARVVGRVGSLGFGFPCFPQSVISTA
jgi:hypothetical protein